MISILRRMFYPRVPPILTSQLGADIANCPSCVRFLNNRYALSFITHAVDHHKIEHDVAVQVLERLHMERWKGKV